MKKPSTVLILGRANVGKSTLFNRLSSSRDALVSTIAGTTRDRKEAVVSWIGREFILIDSGGVDFHSRESMQQQITDQAIKGIDEASLILLVLDTRDGITPLDQEVARFLRKQKKPVLVVANKADTMKQRNQVAEFSQLGLGEAQPVSAANGSGTGDLLDLIAKRVSTVPANMTPSIKVALIGKPNVGKSSLVNALLNDERVIVSPEAHTTRDSQDIQLKYHDKDITLIDTAGLARNQRVDQLKKISMHQALETIKRSDIVLFMTEADKDLSYQDKNLADEIVKTGASVIMVANKWDLIGEKSMRSASEATLRYRRFFPWLSWAPIIFLSAKHKTKRAQLLNLILEVQNERQRYIEDNAADKFLKQMLRRHLPTKGKGNRNPYIYHFQQTHTNPPRFIIKIKFKTSLHESYLRFLENNLRAKFGFLGTPLKIYVEKIFKV